LTFGTGTGPAGVMLVGVTVAAWCTELG